MLSDLSYIELACCCRWKALRRCCRLGWTSGCSRRGLPGTEASSLEPRPCCCRLRAQPLTGRTFQKTPDILYAPRQLLSICCPHIQRMRQTSIGTATLRAAYQNSFNVQGIVEGFGDMIPSETVLQRSQFLEPLDQPTQQLYNRVLHGA